MIGPQDFSIIFRRLLNHYGKQGWWPADSVLEIIIGAILVQGTNWRNAALAIRHMKEYGALCIERLRDISVDELAAIIRPAGFHKIKAIRIKNFVSQLCSKFGWDLDALSRLTDHELRSFLLSVRGIGRETADNIMLYAFNRLIFPVDNYTRRLFKRLGYAPRGGYEELRKWIESNIDKDLEVYREFRALIVRHCKDICTKKPKCIKCPIKDLCNYYKRGKDEDYSCGYK